MHTRIRSRSGNPSRAALGVLALLLLGSAGCGTRRSPVVVVYSAQDPEFAEPVLKAYAAKSGVEIEPKFDVESTKTVGLAQLLIRESPKPRCDLFWNNEILNTLRLKEKGMLASWSPPNAADIPAEFQAKDGTWYGFAARARILVVNTQLVAEADRPKGLADLARPEVEGQDRHRQAPLRHHGHARHLPVRRLGRREGPGVLRRPEEERGPGGLGQQAGGHGRRLGPGPLRPDRHRRRHGRDRRRPPRGDHLPRPRGRRAGHPVHPQRPGHPQGAPHPSEAEALGNYLLGPEAEGKLALGASAQIPLNRKTEAPPRVETPRTVHAMPADFEAAARIWDRVAAYLASEFAGG